MSRDDISEDEYQQLNDTFSQQWKQIKGLKAATEAEIHTRFKQGLNILQSGLSMEQKQSFKTDELLIKQEFCLKHEILCGKKSTIDSSAKPSESQDQMRMQMQVELLKENMGQNTHITPFEIQLQWYKLSNYTQDKNLEKRFKNLIE